MFELFSTIHSCFTFKTWLTLCLNSHESRTLALVCSTLSLSSFSRVQCRPGIGGLARHNYGGACLRIHLDSSSWLDSPQSQVPPAWSGNRLASYPVWVPFGAYSAQLLFQPVFSVDIFLRLSLLMSRSYFLIRALNQLANIPVWPIFFLPDHPEQVWTNKQYWEDMCIWLLRNGSLVNSPWSETLDKILGIFIRKKGLDVDTADEFAENNQGYND